MPVALVTGAGQGLGAETARQLAARGWQVVVAGLHVDSAAEVAAGIGPAAVAYGLDVRDDAGVDAVAAHVARVHGRLDALVSNAGVILDDHGDPDPLRLDPDRMLRTFEVNTVPALRLARAFAPLLVAAGGNVVHVSSGMGALDGMGPGYAAYRASKAALNALTVVLHHALHPRGVRVNSVCPGWVRTTPGGAGAPRSVEEGAAGIVWAATLGPDGPSGGFFRDGRPLPW